MRPPHKGGHKADLTQTAMATQEKIINIQWLLGHGYTPTEAAEVLGVTASHLRRVLKGAPDRGWYLDTEERQVRDGLKDPRTAILPVMERPHDDGRHTR